MVVELQAGKAVKPVTAVQDYVSTFVSAKLLDILRKSCKHFQIVLSTKPDFFIGDLRAIWYFKHQRDLFLIVPEPYQTISIAWPQAMEKKWNEKLQHKEFSFH